MKTPVYMAPECSGTREAASADEEIEWLRDWRAGRTRTRIFGTVIDSLFEKPLQEVAITANCDSKSFATKTDADGNWSFDDVPAGRYQLTAQLANYRAGFADLVEVKARTCATSRLWMEGSGAIPVRVVDALGRPISKIELDIARVENGKLQFGPYEKRNSHENGRFVFAKLPAGSYVVGVNIRFTPSARLPYESTYLPGEHSLKDARVVHLAAGELAAPITLKLPPKIGLRTVRVQAATLASQSPIAMRLEVGQIIRRLRSRRGMTQAALASLTGIHRTYLSRSEHGQVMPSVIAPMRIAGALAVDKIMLRLRSPASA